MENSKHIETNTGEIDQILRVCSWCNSLYERNSDSWKPLPVNLLDYQENLNSYEYKVGNTMCTPCYNKEVGVEIEKHRAERAAQRGN